MEQSFFFYDLETSGLNPREDRVMQFAGQRTTLDLEPVGEPVNILVRLSDDALPSPGAIGVTGITPQMTLMDGVSEAEFCKFVQEEIFVPGTCAVGYNTVRFDDEFMRAMFWRNFYDPYEWQWKDGRSRWDLLDVVRLTRALRPEGIEWPVKEDGRATNRLELLTALNGISHEHAHDALSDVYATIAVARLIHEKQPKLFEFLFKMRSKNEVRKLVNLENKRPFVYASGRYSSEFNKTTVAFPLTSSRNGNVLVFDLRYDVEDLLRDSKQDSERVLSDISRSGARPAGPFASDVPSSAIRVPRGERPRAAGAKPRAAALRTPLRRETSATRSETFYPTVKELCLNKCPAVAPLSVLDEGDGWKKIGLDKAMVEKNLEILLKHPEFAERMREQNENRPEFEPAVEPEAAIYDRFLGEPDRVKVAAVRNASAEELADFHPEFADARLPELLLHYKGRNYPQSLSEAEAVEWEKYRRARLERQAPKFLEELKGLYEKDEFLGEELKLYFESIFDADGETYGKIE